MLGMLPPWVVVPHPETVVIAPVAGVDPAVGKVTAETAVPKVRAWVNYKRAT